MEIKPKVDTATRKWLMTADSFRHPAKMSIPMLLWIVQKYTKLGDFILDPMAGAGTTMLACWMGRNVMLVELEGKFIDMCTANWEKLRQMPPALGFEMGWCEIGQGDARELEAVLADVAIFSPPYAEAQEGGGIAKKGYQGPKHGPTDLVGKRSYMPTVHGGAEGQIGNLPYGSIDAAIFSPPFSRDSEPHGESHEKGRQNGIRSRHPYVDAIISSPPYERSIQPSLNAEKRAQRLERQGIDSGGGHFTGQVRRGTGGLNVAAGAQGYSDSLKNFGNLKGDTYLSAMQQAYAQCHKALKPSGLMILVTKNFIRNKQIVPLDEHTIKLCEGVGFALEERHYRKLTSQSFWRVIYQKKYPDVPVIDREDILIFQK